MQWVLASGNQGKLKEFAAALGAWNCELKPQNLWDIVPAEETGLTFVENALIKARHACAHTGLPALADDSGLEVDVLQGAPGIYSARYAGVGASDAQNNAHLLEALAAYPQEEERRARYWCVLVFMRHVQDPTPIIVQAAWEGRILTQAQGDGGFGYDPLFWVPERGCSAAELSLQDKQALSHRGQAIRLLQNELAERFSV